MKLSIVIPAFNEEASIESIIKRSLCARKKIMAKSSITEIEILVVSDGSTDRTVELASPFRGQIKLIVFKENRGYGAAIKEGWDLSKGDLLGFLDADGTCDPEFFGQLLETLESEKVDVVLGCRLNAYSKMPAIRRMGNRIFALLLSILSFTRVRDVTSGMRVVRRSSLPKILPLPDGLHFTPAMSARVILSGDLKIAEVDMPYYEREGESKLRIGKDGLRFIQSILDAAFLYRPSRPLGFLGLLFFVFAIGVMVMPTIHYLENRSVADWMIYRFVVSNLSGISACLLFCASYLSQRAVDISLMRYKPMEKGRTFNFLKVFFSSSFFWFVPILFVFLGCTLVFKSLMELYITGATFEHWSRFIVMSFLFSTAIILIVTRAVDYTLSLISSQLVYLKSRNEL